jgi:hypothetical protein
MDDSMMRKRRLREKRRDAGWQDQLIWLSPAGQAAMAALRHPGETIDAFFNRALVTLQHQRQSETSPAPGPVTSPVPTQIIERPPAPVSAGTMEGHTVPSRETSPPLVPTMTHARLPPLG